MDDSLLMGYYRELDVLGTLLTFEADIKEQPLFPQRVPGAIIRILDGKKHESDSMWQDPDSVPGFRVVNLG